MMQGRAPYDPCMRDPSTGSKEKESGGAERDVRVEEETGVGEALDGGAPAAGVGVREEGLELVAVEYHRQAAGRAAGEQHLVCRGHPDGEEVPDDGVPDALAPEVKPILLQIKPQLHHQIKNTTT